jgi:hypothetical protein
LASTSAAVLPMGETIPIPVITTRRMGALLLQMLLGVIYPWTW